MLYPHKPGMAEWLNAWAADFAARTPECLHTATFFPEPGCAYVGGRSRGGPGLQGHPGRRLRPADPLLDAVWGTLAEAGVPVVTHCGSGPAAGRFTGPEPIARGWRAIPAAAGRRALRAAGVRRVPDLAERTRGFFDTTMAFTAFIEAPRPFPLPNCPGCGTRRPDTLGTDFPNIPYTTPTPSSRWTAPTGRGLVAGRLPRQRR